jgi:hypothetical protein
MWSAMSVLVSSEKPKSHPRVFLLRSGILSSGVEVSPIVMLTTVYSESWRMYYVRL